MTYRFRRCLAVTAIVALSGLMTQAALAANTSVIFTEVMTGPNEPGGEWVEIYNLTDQSIDLSGWIFDDSGIGYEGGITSGTLPAGGTAVLYDFRAGMTPGEMQTVWGRRGSILCRSTAPETGPTSIRMTPWFCGNSQASYDADHAGEDRLFLTMPWASPRIP